MAMREEARTAWSSAWSGRCLSAFLEDVNVEQAELAIDGCAGDTSSPQPSVGRTLGGECYIGDGGGGFTEVPSEARAACEDHMARELLVASVDKLGEMQDWIAKPWKQLSTEVPQVKELKVVLGSSSRWCWGAPQLAGMKQDSLAEQPMVSAGSREEKQVSLEKRPTVSMKIFGPGCTPPPASLTPPPRWWGARPQPQEAALNTLQGISAGAPETEEQEEGFPKVVKHTRWQRYAKQKEHKETANQEAAQQMDLTAQPSLSEQEPNPFELANRGPGGGTGIGEKGDGVAGGPVTLPSLLVKETQEEWPSLEEAVKQYEVVEPRLLPAVGCGGGLLDKAFRLWRRQALQDRAHGARKRKEALPPKVGNHGVTVVQLVARLRAPGMLEALAAEVGEKGQAAVGFLEKTVQAIGGSGQLSQAEFESILEDIVQPEGSSRDPVG
ncbi:unnamed protein product [Prorocentrum cordatum]|uniref:Uncharacterized protein n=1 Tax=Prorocentrum cordatum TaxID=2364126 RepID=A0ABN9U9K0_9DINO|nr:unnamed protein product [Polarella glacialis]